MAHIEWELPHIRKEQSQLEILRILKQEFLVTPDVVEYDKKKMTRPMYDLILGCKTMKELGIVLDFRTKEITVDEIILLMTDINSLTMSKMERAWSVNNSIAHKPHSMHEAME